MYNGLKKRDYIKEIISPMNNFRTYAYLRALIKEQNADRAKGVLSQG